MQPPGSIVSSSPFGKRGGLRYDRAFRIIAQPRAVPTTTALTIMLLFVDNLTNSDFCYLDPVRGLVGETWLSHIELEGELDDQGMICDFGVVKACVRSLLDDYIDHCLLLPYKADNLILEDLPEGNQCRVLWTLDNGQQIIHTAPGSAVTQINSQTISPASVGQWCETRLRKQLPDSVKQVRISFSAETIDGASYHYSHGLKKHEGKCQRIAHGHRSKIEVYRNGQRDSGLENYWADSFRDIYIGTREDLLENQDDNQYYRFRYRAAEGTFALQLPKAQCYLIDKDSTVENIARHLAEQTKAMHPDDLIAVKAYEGINKGAWVSL